MFALRWILLCVCMILSILSTAHAGDLADAQQLWSDLFTNYNYRIKPINNQSAIVSCNVTLNILSLNEINEVDEVMRITGFLGVSWVDESLQWNRTQYGDISYMLAPQNEVWKPDILLTNANGKAEETGLTSLNVVLYDNGEVSWYPFQKYECACSIDVRYFPFDTQTCVMIFKAWSYSQSEVVFENGNIYLDSYSESSSWEITSVEHKNDPDTFEPNVHFIFSFKRKPLYTVLSMILPVVFLSFMNLFVFVVPVSCGEKVGYSITVFLSFAVFLTLIEASMPKNSESISLLSIYMIILTGISTIITFIAIGMVKVMSVENLRVPVVFVWMSRIGSFKICRKQKKTRVEAINKLTLEQIEKDMELGGKNQTDNITSRSSSSMSSYGREEKPTWESIMNGLEMFCLYVFTIILVLVSLVILIGIKVGKI